MRADPEDRHDAGEHDEDDDQRQHRARPRRAARRLIGLFDLAAEAAGRHPLAGIGLHGPDRADQFGGVRTGVRQRILRVARQPPHPAPERHQRNHDQRNSQQHEAGQFRARDHHHGGGADEQHHVAQRDRYRRADRGFDLGGIGGQPRHQFARARGIEECGRQRDQMREHVAPDIGDDALADRHHEVVARRACRSQHRDNGDHDAEIAVDQGDAFGAEAEIDHAPDRDRHDQRGDRGNRQRDEGKHRASAVAGDIGRQCQERPQLGAGLGRRLRQLALDEGLFIEQGVARRRAAGGFDLFHCAHEIRPVFQPSDRPPRPPLANPGDSQSGTIRSLFWWPY